MSTSSTYTPCPSVPQKIPAAKLAEAQNPPMPLVTAVDTAANAMAGRCPVTWPEDLPSTMCCCRWTWCTT